MNIEVFLLEKLPGLLKAVGVDALEFRADPKEEGFDGWVTLRRGAWQRAYIVEVKPALARAGLLGAIEQMRAYTERTGEAALLLADYVTPPMAQTLRQHKQAFVDLAGNAYIEDGAVFINIVGNKPVERPAPKARGFTHTTAGIKLTFALLCQPQLIGAPMREIAAAAGVALGTVVQWVKELEAHQIAHQLGGRRLAPVNKKLLDEWAVAYARRLRPKTLKALYEADLQGWQDWPLKELNPKVELMRWGGEPAAALLTGHLQPGVLTLYGTQMPIRLIVWQQLRRIDTPAEANREHAVLELREPFWGKALDEALPRPDVVPPVLVYADLIATGDGRCYETAQILYEKHLARLFENT